MVGSYWLYFVPAFLGEPLSNETQCLHSLSHRHSRTPFVSLVVMAARITAGRGREGRRKRERGEEGEAEEEEEEEDLYCAILYLVYSVLCYTVPGVYCIVL